MNLPLASRIIVHPIEGKSPIERARESYEIAVEISREDSFSEYLGTIRRGNGEFFHFEYSPSLQKARVSRVNISNEEIRAVYYNLDGEGKSNSDLMDELLSIYSVEGRR